ncbi:MULTISPECIES: DMT family transporter [Bilophila]|jgi:DME family drug/metabolite transporter|uniref:DMT family transporter n=1 Tax=Bilophila TaxID=35832 RepID=UPI0002238E75|nr:MULTISPECIES: EamA family transporter [Bilophila]EGW43863.1 hypothetical protein HMPREF0178_03285 [Bilophila sp. 4_1_30]
MAKDSKQVTGYLYVLAAAVLWSLIGPFSKICMEEGLAPLEVAFWRALLGGICFFAQTGICGGARIPVKHAMFFCLFGVLSISVFFSSLQISIQLSGAAMAMVLLYTAPAWVAVFSRILFHESFSSRKGIALALALFGTALVCFSGGSLNAEPSVLGIVCGLISGLCYASHFPFYVWWQPRYSTATLYAYMLLGGALALLPFVDFAPTRSWTAWANLLALGVVTNYGAYLAYGRSLQLISQVKAAIIGNIEPVLATFWVWLFWHENFSAYGWAGSALVISAVFLLTADRS